jgi:hypothetical protein
MIGWPWSEYTKICRAYYDPDKDGSPFSAIPKSETPPDGTAVAPEFVWDDNANIVGVVMDEDPDSPGFGSPVYWFWDNPTGVMSTTPTPAENS